VKSLLSVTMPAIRHVFNPKTNAELVALWSILMCYWSLNSETVCVAIVIAEKEREPITNV
jgi:hypothetical protein